MKINLFKYEYKHILLPLVLLLFLCTLTLPAYDQPERAALMDPKVNIVLHISNGAAFLNALEESPYGKLWNSPEMKPFLNNQGLQEALIKNFFLPAEGLNANEEVYHLNRRILSMFKGEVLMGVELGKAGNDTQLFFLVEMNEPDYKKTRELIEQESKAAGEKVVSHRHSFQGTELVQDITTMTDEKKEIHEWMAFSGNTFINGTSREWVEQCVVRLKKEMPVSPSGPPSLQLWLPDGSLRQILDTKEEEKDPGEEIAEEPDTGPYSAGTLKAMGVDAAGRLSLEWKLYPTYSELSLQARIKGEAKGLWTLFPKDPAPRSLSLGYVPDNVLSYQVMGLNIHSFWNEIPVMLESLNAESSAQFRMGLAAASQMLQVDVERDIVANLDTVFTTYSVLEGTEDITLYAWQLRNPAAIEKTLGKLFAEGAWMRSMLKENFELLDLLGHKVYSLKFPKVEIPVGGSEPPKQPVIKFIPYGVTVVDGDLVIGRLSMVRSFIHGSQDPKAGRKFYKSPIYAFMNARVPDNAAGYGLSDINQLIRPGLNFFKNMGQRAQALHRLKESAEEAEEKSETPLEPDALDTFFSGLKFDRLPSPEFLRSFFGPWISYYQFNGDELNVRWEFHNPLTGSGN